MTRRIVIPSLTFVLVLLFSAGAGAQGPVNELVPYDQEARLAVKLTGDPAALHKVFIGFRLLPGPAEEALVHGLGGRIKFTYHVVPAIAATLPEAAITALVKNPKVSYIEPDIEAHAIDAELDNSWGVKQIGAGTVHAGGNKGAGVKVAIIDTGIDYNHPDLLGRYAGGYDFVNRDNDPLDDNGHGTHVAGIIAADDNGFGVVGVAPEARLYALKILDKNGSGDYSNVVAALQWAVDFNKANAGKILVTNNSYGSDGDPGQTVQAAFDAAQAADILNVAAAGNSGLLTGILPPLSDTVNYPAKYASVVAVSATDINNIVATFSSAGPKVELAAPGVNINSTIPGGGYQVLSGTSMASPHAAGAAALVIASGITDTNNDGLINDEVRQRLDGTATDLGDQGRDWLYGYGLVNAAAAAAPAPPPSAVNVSVSTDKSSYITGTDTKALLTTAVTDGSGTPISGLGSSAFSSTIDTAPFNAGFTETTKAGTYSGQLGLTSLADGSHTVAVTVYNAAKGTSGSGSATFTLGAPKATKVTVKSITYSMTGSTTKTLNIKLTVVNDLGNPVGGASVQINLNLNGVPYAFGFGTTLSDGTLTFKKSSPPRGCYTTDVLQVTATGLTWDGKTPANSYCVNRR